MPRHVLSEDRIHPGARDVVAAHHRDLVEEVQREVEGNDVVVVGMAMNSVAKKARQLLKDRGVAFRYLEYGGYTGNWRRRNALKMWTGWPTFPMVFVKGTLVGGHSELSRLSKSGELAKLLAE